MFVGEMIDVSNEIGSLNEAVSETVQGTLKAYADGYANGYDWPAKWGNRCPGGPWVFGNGTHCRWYPDSPEEKRWRAMAAQSRAENEAWRTGWQAGYARNPNKV